MIFMKDDVLWRLSFRLSMGNPLRGLPWSFAASRVLVMGRGVCLWRVTGSCRWVRRAAKLQGLADATEGGCARGMDAAVSRLSAPGGQVEFRQAETPRGKSGMDAGFSPDAGFFLVDNHHLPALHYSYQKRRANNHA